ncbi:MAG: discoidin domain-containing protein [Gemmatimonadaceae bacterium]
MRTAKLFTLAFILVVAGPAGAQERVLDDFESVAGWTAQPSDGVSLSITRDSGRTGSAMRLDYDFHDRGGYAIAKRVITLDLPDNYEFSFWVRGEAMPQNLELKLLDSTGENVWWTNRRDFVFPRSWTRVVTKKRHIEFAWGPVRVAELRRVFAFELTITAGSGGKGTVWVDDLRLTPRPAVTAISSTPLATASSSVPRSMPHLAVDRDTSTVWRSARDGAQHLDVDFGAVTEFGAAVLRWAPDAHATSYEVLSSADGRTWNSIRTVQTGNGGADFLYLPEGEARFIRLLLHSSARRQGYALREFELKPIDWARSANAFFEQLARESPRGQFPKYFLGVQSYWTVAGAQGDSLEVLVNEEGAIEHGSNDFSLEPFLRVGDQLIKWSDVRLAQQLEGGDLPIPSVRWEGAPVALEVTAMVTGRSDASTLWVRYRVGNPGNAPQRATLYLTLRPFQVNPIWQSLKGPGGVGRIQEIAYDGRTLKVNGDQAVIPVTAPSAFGAAAFDEGDVTDFLSRNVLPPNASVGDSTGWASGAFSYVLDIPAGGSLDVWVALPLHAASARPPAQLTPRQASLKGDSALAAVVREWTGTLRTFRITLPRSAERVVRSIRSNLAYILINRDGAAIQPGSRSYSRSWIRDGSLTSEALLRLGHEREVREFIEWYAPFQYPYGKVPCCVDRRGADPVPEHDSHGQLIFLIAEYWRFTRDTAFVRKMWPHVTGAVAYMDSLRQSRMTPIYRTDSIAYYGLLPQSISHEGYSAKPMHSYWDDFFALKGLKDAAALALVIGDAPRARSYAILRDDFRSSVLASFRHAMSAHRIDYLPGAVELGDFDATSTTVGINPGGELAHLPREAVAATFDRYWRNFRERRDSDTTWNAYVPYEHRVTGTYVRLGQPERAHALLDYFFRDQRPAAWNHWAEVVWRRPETPRFIGDMPHTWVGSDFIRSVLDMFAYEREADSSLVLAAAVRPEWLAEKPGIAVEGLRTHYGPVSYTMRRSSDRSGDVVRMRIHGTTRIPPGGIAVVPPPGNPPRTVMVAGRAAHLSAGGDVIIRSLPAEMVFRY